MPGRDELETLVDGIEANEPAVNESSVQALTAADVNTKPLFDGDDSATPPDDLPEQFDPSIHRVNGRGRPIKTKDGRFAKRSGPKSTKTTTAAAVATSKPETPPDYGAAGKMLAGFIFGTTTTLFGPAWKPETLEQANIESASTEYCRSCGFADVPPGVALLLAIGMYAGPRLNDPETRARLRGFGESIGLLRPKPQPTPEPVPPVANAPVQQPQPSTGFVSLGG